jgi:hypothetical protein
LRAAIELSNGVDCEATADLFADDADWVLLVFVRVP